jgi:hypothetical protein
MNEPEGPGARLREAFAGLSERAVPGPSCPEPDRLWAAATAEAPAEERREIVAHTATCASCAGAFRLALGLSREERGHASGKEGIAPLLAPSRPWFQRSAPLAALAAALLIAVLVPVWWRSQPVPAPQYPPQYRDVETLEIRSRLAEGAALPRNQAVLSWSAGPSGSLYEVRVLTREAREIAVEAELEVPRYQIPPSALAGIPPDTILYWQVKALRPDGTNVVSKTFSIRLQ